MKLWPSMFTGLLAATLTVTAQTYDEKIAAEKPAAYWSLDEKPEEAKGDADFTYEGPRPPEAAFFAEDNRAAGITKAGHTLKLPHRPELAFDQNDTIHLEAWIDLRGLPDGNNVYIVGKGRTRNPGYPEDNQNYALRLRGIDGEARLSFLFRSRPDGDYKGNWHRWNSNLGITADSGWHHVSASYTFGKPESIRGTLDGEAVGGTWDMGGATKRAPVVDDDEIWIGGSMGGSSASQFSGGIDALAIFRTPPSLETLKQRIQIKHIPLKIEPENLQPGVVRVDLFDKGIPEKGWPRKQLEPALTYRKSAYGFFRAPLKYIDTGIREDWSSPFMLRASSRVTLPAGKHQLLLRALGGTRVFMDGKVVASLPFKGGFKDAHGTVKKTYLEPAPGARYAAPGCAEKLFDLEVEAGEHVFVCDIVVGGMRGKDRFRQELSETTVSIQLEGDTGFHLLSPTRRVPLTDTGWETYVLDENPMYDWMNDAARAKAYARSRAHWEARHETARRFIEPRAIQVSDSAHANPVDHFIAQGLAQRKKAADESPAEKLFREKVSPILSEKCERCHGKKVKGELRLTSRAQALKGGESGHPALVPGKPEASQLIERIQLAEDDEDRMPPKGEPLSSEEIALLSIWIKDGAVWPESTDTAPLTRTDRLDDHAFLRKAYLDTVGVTPTLKEIDAFFARPESTRREQVIETLLEDNRWADHWVSYWQDVLAENPNIVKPSLNNSGPFRWWIHEAFRDNKPMDLFVTELIQMRGSKYAGGPKGFEMAAQNDVPMAAKAAILSTAFLGVELKCARCHDAPYHPWKQEELFQLAAMLNQKPISLPKTSSVPMDKLHQGGRKPKITVSLKPGTSVKPEWPFEQLAAQPAETPEDTRAALAAWITSPDNDRFAQVMVNRIWKRYMGRGLVEPVHDWAASDPSHPELLQWLGEEFVRQGYDLKQLARVILTSEAYQRAAHPEQDPGTTYASAIRRRLTAEQIVDSLFVGVGLSMKTEPLTLDLDNTNRAKNFVNLGEPRRAWMFTSLSNERDRPSLALPRAQAVIDALTAFGWRPSRQEPLTDRGEEPNVIQPAILSNGTMGNWLTRLSDDHALTEWCLQNITVNELVEKVFLQLYTRLPDETERARYTELLTPGFNERRTGESKTRRPSEPPRFVTWSNHLNPEANEIAIENEAKARKAYPPSPRLESDWRARMEDMIWALANSPEMIYSP